MKTNRFLQWTIATVLFGMLTMTNTSCTDDDDMVESQTIEIPTDDVMEVTTAKSYSFYGKWDDDFGKALSRRLHGRMTPPLMADFVVIDPSTISHSDLMSNDELKTIIRRSEAGELPIVLTKATYREFYDFAQLYVMGALLIQFENFLGDHSYDSPQAAPLRKNMADVIHNAYTAGQRRTLMTRSSVDGKELDWEHVNTWPIEKQNAIMFDGFAQCGSSLLYVLNAEASVTDGDNDVEIEQPDTEYEWGQKADAVVEWLNRQNADKAKLSSGMKRFAKSVTRAESTTSISDLKGARTIDYVYEYNYPKLDGSGTGTVYSAINAHYTIYSVYDFDDKADYYQVIQNITIRNDKIHQVQNGDKWAECKDTYNQSRGAWLSSLNTYLSLLGSGTKTVLSAAPVDENGTSTYSQSSGGSTTKTTGGSVGLSGGIGYSFTSGLQLSLGVSGTVSFSKSKGVTWGTSSGWSTKDLTTNYTPKIGDEDGAVEWTYVGNTPDIVDNGEKTDFDATSSDRIKQLLKGTCVTNENVIWKVENPKDSFILYSEFDVISEIAKRKYDNKYKTYYYDQGSRAKRNNRHVNFIYLRKLNRFKREWNNVIYNYGTKPDNMDQIEYTSYIDDYIETAYGTGQAIKEGNYCWATTFTSAEIAANSSNYARAVFQQFKNSISGMKQQLRAKGVKGRLVFGLKPEGEESLLDSIALILDGTGYNIGETFTENVNGYDLTFKVTKKGAEVELDSVPKDFTGELVIPSTTNGLSVTALGDYCAIGCTKITSVTIPSTVTTIGTGALAEMNISSIIIPEGVTTIDPWAFHADSLVTTLSLPTSLKTIEDHAFSGLKKLKDLVIPEGVTTIDVFAFGDDKDIGMELEKISLPKSIKTIGNSAFMNCNNLKEVHIKATTPPTLGDEAFSPRYEDAILYVPKGTLFYNYKRDYSNATEWKKFKTIKEE